MDIGSHVKVANVSHLGRKKKVESYKVGKIIAYYPNNFFLVDFGIYKECYRERELIELKV